MGTSNIIKKFDAINIGAVSRRIPTIFLLSEIANPKIGPITTKLRFERPINVPTRLFDRLITFFPYKENSGLLKPSITPKITKAKKKNIKILFRKSFRLILTLFPAHFTSCLFLNLSSPFPDMKTKIKTIIPILKANFKVFFCNFSGICMLN